MKELERHNSYRSGEESIALTCDLKSLHKRAGLSFLFGNCEALSLIYTRFFFRHDVASNFSRGEEEWKT